MSEFAEIGTTVGVTAFASGNVTYELTSDGGGRFAIDPVTGVVTVAGRLDYETQREHWIGVFARSSDKVLGNLLKIHVQDEAEPTVEVNVIDIDFESPYRQQLRVKYRPATGTLDRSTIGNNDIEVVAPDGSVFTPVYTGHGNFSTGRFFDGNYSMVPPGGFWDAGDNGSYEVRMRSEEVGDDRGAWIPSHIVTTFQVNIHDGPVPTAEVSAADINEPTTGSHDVTVVVKADGVLSFDAAAEPAPFTLHRPDGSPITPVLKDVQRSADGHEVKLTYAVWPNGQSGVNASWDASDNGLYSIVATDARIRDSRALLLRGGIVGSFVVDIATDVTGPTALMSVESLTQSSPVAHQIRVEYQDASSLNVDSIGTGDISVVVPAGWTVQPTFESLSFLNGLSVATYSLLGSAGSWDSTDNGSYQVFLNAGEVTDSRGNGSAAAAIGSFEVDIPSLLPADLNGDGLANFADFLILSFHFGSQEASAEEGDLNGDGTVNFRDFLRFSASLS